MSQRMTVVLLIGLAVVAATIAFLFASPPAHGASICERHGMVKQITRGGRSWRCKRVRAHRVHQVALRVPQIEPQKITPTTLAEKSTLPIDAVRTVRVIPIINGFTVQQRIERAFDVLIRFPIEDEP